jgi:glutaredoxin
MKGGACKTQKAWLSENEIEFTEKNIAEDDSALKELQELGVQATPVTLVDGELVVGFDRDRLASLLGLKG